MSERKLTIYQRNTGRLIVLTDKMNLEPIEELKSKLSDLMCDDNKIIKFQTIDDFLIIRSDEIGGIMLSAEGEFKNDIPSPSKLAKTIVSDVKKKTLVKDEKKEIQQEDSADYEQILVIEESAKNEDEK